MISKQKATKQAFQFLALIVLSSLLLILEASNRASYPRDLLQNHIATPLKKTAKWPAAFYQNILDYFSSKSALLNALEQQSKEAQILKATLLNHNALEAENRRLKLLFNSTYNRSEPVVVAEVLDAFIDAYQHQILVNKGSENDVFVGQVAIDGSGIVGQITQANPKTAMISLLSDPRQYIPVVIERNLVRTVVKGSGYLHELETLYLPLDADVKVGDMLITSGLGGVYPRGYPVARITSIARDSDQLFLTASASPVANIAKTLEVLLLKTETIAQ